RCEASPSGFAINQNFLVGEFNSNTLNHQKERHKSSITVSEESSEESPEESSEESLEESSEESSEENSKEGDNESSISISEKL
ncbi:16635_t:CDS:2, partial [Gigaspora rosea]